MTRCFALLSVLGGVLIAIACQTYNSDLIDTTRSRTDADSDDSDAQLSKADGGGRSGQESGVSLSQDADIPDRAVDSNSRDEGDAGKGDGSNDAGQDASEDASDAGEDTRDADQDANEDAGQDAGEDAQLPDECPDDPDKSVPGTCGCGIPDTDVGDTASCTGLIDALVRRYRFEGSGTTIVDSIGDANGTTNATLSGDGTLTLSGGSSDEYAILPERILSSLSAATVEFWITWQGGNQRQRLLSFGTAVPTEPDSSCAGDPEYHEGSWYQFCNAQKKVWTTARSLCEDADGYLVAIESAEEQQYLDAHSAFTASVWIGANDRVTEGEWYFATRDGLQGGVHFWSGDGNGSALAGAYENWHRDSSQPNDSDPDADCGLIYFGTTPHTWGSFDCQTVGSYVCEWRGHQGSAMNRGVWFTPADNSDRPSLTFDAGGTVAIAQAADAFPVAVQTHVALLLDPANNLVSLYIDGVLAASATSTDPLGELRDADNWLGRSQVTDDPLFSGTLSELRIYGSALTEAQLVTSFLAGPDPEFLEP